MHFVAGGLVQGSFHAFVEVVVLAGDGKYRIQIPALSTSLTRSTSQSCQRKVGVKDKRGEKLGKYYSLGEIVGEILFIINQVESISKGLG